jgi:gamma-glutamylcyclotransferase
MFLYFAYGSNMLTRRLAARTPSATVVTTGYVEGYRLTFDKVSSDGSGKCDIEATRISADRVYGVLFSIAESEEGALDDAEGLGHGYRKGEVQIVTPDGTSKAIAFSATNKNPALLPYDWYKDFVVQGAVEHDLPTAYITKLRAIRSQPDRNAARRARNEALLES